MRAVSIFLIRVKVDEFDVDPLAMDFVILIIRGEKDCFIKFFLDLLI